jgi:hypothetical protein
MLAGAGSDGAIAGRNSARRLPKVVGGNGA